MIAEILKQYGYKKLNDRPKYPKERHWPSDAAKCLRALVYQWRGEQPRTREGRFFFILSDGEAHHKLITQQLEEAGVQVTMKEAPLRDPKLNISGKLDALIKFNDKYYVLEIKSINRYGFDEIIRDGPKEDHVIQLQLYLHFVQNLFKIDAKSGILLYKNKDTSSFYDFQVDYNEMVVRDFFEKLKIVEENIAKGTLPDRPYERTDWHCQYCDYKETCWLGVSADSIAQITDEELVRLVGDLIYTKSQRKEFELKEDELVKQVKEQFKKRNLTKSQIGSYILELKKSPMRRLDQKKLLASLGLDDKKLEQFYETKEVERLDIKEYYE